MARRSVQYLFLFLPLLTGVVLLFLPGGTQAQRPPTGELPAEAAHHIEPEKLIFLLQYLGTDYGAAVQAGQVVSSFEYQEMLDFSHVLIEEYEKLRPQDGSEELLLRFSELRRLIEDKEDWSEVRTLASSLVPALSEQLNVFAYPTIAPDVSRGEKIFAANCARCHGDTGAGDGPSAVDMEPPPRSFRDPRMNFLPAHQIYNAVTFGVEGTDMPSHQETMSEQERWDVAFFVMIQRDDFNPVQPDSELSVSLRDLAAHSNQELVERFTAAGIETTVSHIDYFRRSPPGPSPVNLLERAQQKLNQSLEFYGQGQVDRAVRLTLDAYLEGIEPVEPALQQRDSALMLELERQIGSYRALLRSGAPVEAAGSKLQELRNLSDQARETLTSSKAEWGVTLLQSMGIILREGIEAALLLGLMLTYLAASGYRQLQKYAVFGAVAGIVLGILTWFAAQFMRQVSPLQQAALEGLTSLLAAGVLFSVSLWIIHHADIQHWKTYIRAKAEEALGTGSGLVLACAAFLAVYREAFETVLFYQALWMRAGSNQSGIVVGFIAGGIVLSLLMLLMFRFGLRIPIKPFFAITGAILGILSFMFAGYGVRELQNIGWIKETPVNWITSIPILEIRPFLESSALQFGILLSFLLGWLLNRRLGQKPAG